MEKIYSIPFKYIFIYCWINCYRYFWNYYAFEGCNMQKDRKYPKCNIRSLYLKRVKIVSNNINLNFEYSYIIIL